MDQEDVGAAERPGTAGCWKEPGRSWSHVQGTQRPVHAPSWCTGACKTEALMKIQMQDHQKMEPNKEHEGSVLSLSHFIQQVTEALMV